MRRRLMPIWQAFVHGGLHSLSATGSVWKYGR
jgi:hypothetical protein